MLAEAPPITEAPPAGTWMTRNAGTTQVYRPAGQESLVSSSPARRSRNSRFDSRSAATGWGGTYGVVDGAVVLIAVGVAASDGGQGGSYSTNPSEGPGGGSGGNCTFPRCGTGCALVRDYADSLRAAQARLN